MTSLTSRYLMPMPAVVLAAITIGGCKPQLGAGAPSGAGDARAAMPSGRPQAIDPAAGVQAVVPEAAGPVTVGDLADHAPSLVEVRSELKRLNLCGGVTDSSNMSPIVGTAPPGFIADPGTSQTEGRLPRLTAQLGALGRSLGMTIYGISGYRTPADSVAVGGYADDPHTKGEAEDIGVGSLLRSSAAQISERELAEFGLYRPFDPADDPNNPEVNHIQLIPAAGPLTLAQANAAWDPDPSC